MTQIFNRKSQVVKRRILRNNATKPELLLWSKLKNKQLGGYRFRRQFSIGRYVADFYCPESGLVVEVDGPSHNLRDEKQHDKQRNLFMKSLGLVIVRFSNDDVINKIEYVILAILSSLPLTKGKGGFRR